MSRQYGYVRVSATDQNASRQIIAMKEFGIEEKRLLIDRQSGKDFDRPAYLRLVRRIKPGDLLVVKSIDRLGRNYQEIIEQWRVLTKEKGVEVVVLDMPLLDTRKEKNLLGTFIADLVLQVLSFVAENERANIRQRQREGIAAAKQRGVQFGRPPKDIPQLDEIVQKWKEGELNATQAANEAGLSRRGFYKRVNKMKMDI